MTRRDCTHPRAHHEHGSRNAYVCDRCRCAPCTAAAAYSRAHNKSKAFGRYHGLVDAEPARQHVRALSAAGIGLKQITRLGGPSGGVLCKLMYGQERPDGTRRPPSKRITPRVADSILRIPATPEITAGGIFVAATGTRRRLEALIYLGYTQSELARRLDKAPSNFGKILRAERVSHRTARDVAALYEHLWDQPAVADDHRSKISVSRARRTARERGYLPPLAWDDDTIDDPTAEAPVHITTTMHAKNPIHEADESPAPVDEIAIERAMHGDQIRLTRAERSEVVARLTARGMSAREIAQRLHTSDRTIVRRRNAA